MDTLDCCQCFYLTPTLICAPDFQLVEGGHEDKNYAISLLKHWLLPFPAILSRSSTHPPSPCLYSPPGCHWGFHLRVVGASNAEADNQTQVSPLVTRMYLSPDAWWPRQEVIRGQVTSPGGPSCPRVASQEGRMRFVVLRRLSLTLLSSAWREKLDYWFQARLSSSCLFFILLFLSAPFFISFSLVSAPTLFSFDIIPFFFCYFFPVRTRCE